MKSIYILLFVFFGLVFAKDAVIVKVNQPGQMVLEISIDSTWISSRDQLIHTSPNLESYLQPGLPILPYFQEIFSGIPIDADVKVFSDKEELIGKYNPIILGPEKSKGLEIEFELPIEYMFDGYFPNQSIKLNPLKDVNGVPTSKIEIFPFSIKNGQLFVTKNISVQISWDIAVKSFPAKLLSKIPFKDLKSEKKLKKPAQNTIPDYQFNNNIAKITVDASAWYKISNSELLSNNINLTGVNTNLIRIWNKEDEILLYIDDGGDGSFNNDDMIVFYGEINPSPDGTDYDYNFYTDDNVYWLTWGAGEGLRFEERDVSTSLPTSSVYTPEYFIDTLKIEKESRYFRLNYNNKYLFQTWDITDHIFMAASVTSGGTRNINFILPDPVSSINNSVAIEALVYGVTYQQHVLDIKLNNNELFGVEWVGQSSLSANNYNGPLYSSDILLNGNNQFSLLLNRDYPSVHDRMELNWFKVIYPRYYRAFNGYIEFNSTGQSSSTTQFNVQNVPSQDILLVRNKNQALINYDIDYIAQENTYTVSFQDSNSELNYELITKDKLISVKKLTLEEPLHNLLNNIQNSYIAICPDSFKAILDPLLDIHSGIAIDVEDIYRQYNGGILSPYAIKLFLSDLYYNNNLEYVLIALQNNLYDQCCSQAANQRDAFIPGMHVFVYEWGDLVSDTWYTLLDDDNFSDIAIGRFPAANSIELQEMVNKTIRHLERDYKTWDNNALLIGGRENVFTYQSEDLANNFIDNGQFLSRIYVAEETTSNFYYSNTDTLLNHFNRGLAYVNFLGHGGAYVWSDAQLLNRDAIKNEIIRNGNKTPFITSMTCYTGDISRPNSLGRYMLTNQYGGALAWYGSAGPGWQNGDYQMVKPLQKLLFSDENLSIGELINKSKMIYYIANYNFSPEITKSQLYQFNLIGDPALMLKKPLKDNIIISPLDPEPGEGIEISSNNSPTDSVFFQIFLPDNYSLNQPTLLENSLPTEISLPDTYSKGIHSINISYKSDDILYNSSQLLSIGGTYINIQSIIPSIPTICDSIGIIAEISDSDGISSVQLIVNGNHWSNMQNFEGNLYSLENLIPPQPTETSITLVCLVIDANNDTTYSLPKIVQKSAIPNTVPLSGKFQVNDEINLAIDIENTTATPVSASVELFINNEDNWQLIGKDTVNFVGMEIKEAIFPGYYPFGTNRYKVVSNANLTCTSSDLVTDDTLTFDLVTNAFWITPELGSTDNGINHSKIGINNVEIDIPSGLVSESSILQILLLSDVIIPSQPDFEVIQSQQNYDGIDIIWDTFNNYEINWAIGESEVQSDNRLYRYFEEFRTWLQVAYTEVSDSTINFASSGSAKFAFLENTDVEKPTIVATVNDQHFLRNNYLNKNPSIQLTIYDKNGIDHRADSIYYWINNNIMNIPSEIIGSGNGINVITNPTFSEFDSTLAILVQDAAGNKSDTLQLSFIVSEKLDLIDYGNYPNPFAESTVFAYELTDAVEKFTFTIYTVEGRKIRRLDNENIISGSSINLPGYHEIEWDGKNQDGFQVGNGNYFYQIRAKNNKTVLERTGKLLKAK